MTKLRLSHSACNKYVDCPKAYEYHYKKRYRSTTSSAALMFGTAIDRAADDYMKERNIGRAKEIFRQTWREQDVNGEPTGLFTCPTIVYSNNDLDVELLDESDHKLVIENSHIKDFTELLAYLVAEKDKKGFDNMKHEDKVLFNAINWLCMRRKGHFMLDKFAEFVDKNVKECLGSQIKIELEDDKGNAVIGYVDFLFRLNNDELVLYDLKTSGRAYEEDSVKKSPQLALYSFYLKDKYPELKKAGYLVLHKTIKKNRTKICQKCGYDGTGKTHKTCDNTVEGKRCHGDWNFTLNPEAIIQNVVDEIPDLMVERVVENFNEVCKAIEAEIFPRNFNNCIKYNGTVKCDFYDLCHGNSMKGLIDKGERKDG